MIWIFLGILPALLVELFRTHFSVPSIIFSVIWLCWIAILIGEMIVFENGFESICEYIGFSIRSGVEKHWSRGTIVMPSQHLFKPGQRVSNCDVTSRFYGEKGTTVSIQGIRVKVQWDKGVTASHRSNELLIEDFNDTTSTPASH